VIFRLRNPIQRYAWGSPDRLPRFLGVEPDGTPQAELWMGAHPSAPSMVECHEHLVPLDRFIAANVEQTLGATVAARFGSQLPFLVKLLAAERPLSLQVHPDATQARAGFEREEADGLAVDDPTRNYRDPNHKPELLCALDHFDVLSGFRSAGDCSAVLEAFGLHHSWGGLAAKEGVAVLCGALWDLDIDEQKGLADAVRRAAVPGGPAARRFPREADFVRVAFDSHGLDVGLVVGLCLDRVRLNVGEALFAPARVLHAYLDGFGLEVMANSDNVVRAGLTAKHVDVAELRALLDDQAPPSRKVTPVLDDRTGELVYPQQVEEFSLSSFMLDGDPVPLASPGPEVLVCTDGGVDVIGSDGTTYAIERGGSLFVPAVEKSYRLRGVGQLYRTRVGMLARGLL